MASGCQTRASLQEEKDYRLAYLIQQQESLTDQLETDSSTHKYTQYADQFQVDTDKAIQLSLSDLSPSNRTQTDVSGDLETDGPELFPPHQPVLMAARRGNRWNSSSNEQKPQEEEQHQQEISVSDEDVSEVDYYQSSEQRYENFNQNRTSLSEDEEEDDDEEGDVENPEIHGASNFVERRRSLGNEDEEEIAREIKEMLNQGSINATVAESLQENQERKFRLNNMTKWQRNCNDEKLRPFAFDTDGVPVNWTADESSNQRLGHSVEVRLVELQPGQLEYNKIESEFEDTGIKITNIERIQNTYLLERFKSEMEDTKRRRNTGFDLNIRYLYHGTKADKSRICEEGLDQRLSRMGYFGKGIYFSDNPVKCVYYAENMDSIGDAYILKCRVILGDSKCYPEGQYDTSLKREPEKENVRPGMWRFYDSVVGCPRDYNEFVVYENRRAMIEYIISFKISPEGAAAIQKGNTASTSSSVKNPEIEEAFDGSHLDRIREVREAVRKKRCQDKGVPYAEPTQDKKRQDDLMWNRLQVLHGVKDDETPSRKGMPGVRESQTTSVSNVKKVSNAQSLTPPNSRPHSTSGWETPAIASGTPRGGNFEMEPDPVEVVMSGLIQEFLAVTSIEDVEMAKYYIQGSKMDVNEALINYYNDLP